MLFRSHVVETYRNWSRLVGSKDARKAADLLELQRFGGTSMAGGADRLWSRWMRNNGPYGKARSLSSRIDDKEKIFVADAYIILRNLQQAADKIDRALMTQAISDLQAAGIRFIN